MNKGTYNPKYYIKNKAKMAKASKKWKDNNKERVTAEKREWRHKNKDKVNAYFRNRRQNDINFRLRGNLSRRLNHALGDNTKSTNILQMIGCTSEELRQWLESQFTEGMTWENYGEWHIDHVYPLSKFNLKQPYEQKIAFNWLNLQPLWAKDNIDKSNKLNIN